MPRTVPVPRLHAPVRPARRTAARQPAASAEPLREGRQRAMPRVSIHLPICQEPPALVRRTLDALSRLDYPDYEVLVIDSNTRDPALWEPVAEHCARLGARFRFCQLGEWPGGKAGALNFALLETTPDVAVIGVLDSGAVVRPAWLRRMLPLFADPAVGFAWSPRLDPASPWTEPPPNRLGAELIPDSAVTLVRRDAIATAGGWTEGAVAGTTELGLRLLRGGWRGACLPEGFGGLDGPPGFADAAWHSFRHAYAVAQLCRTHLPALLSPLAGAPALRQRGSILAGWLPCFADALEVLLVVAALAWSAGLLLDPRQVGFPAPPLTLLPMLLCALALLRAVHHHARSPDWRRDAVAVLNGFALSHAAGKGFWHALLGGAPPVEPSPAQRLAPVRAELVLLVLCWGAIAGILAQYGLGRPETWFWCGMLLVQSLPCLAAVLSALATDADLPRSRRVGPR